MLVARVMGVLNLTFLCVSACLCAFYNDLCKHKWAQANPLTVAHVTERPCYQCELCIVLQPVIYFTLCWGKQQTMWLFPSKLIAGCATLETNVFAFATRGRISR